jgi:hypothetical protein
MLRYEWIAKPAAAALRPTQMMQPCLGMTRCKETIYQALFGAVEQEMNDQSPKCF